MEDIAAIEQLKKGYANGTVSRGDIIRSYTGYLCGTEGLSLDNVKTITGANTLRDFLSLKEYQEVLHQVLKATMKRKRLVLTVKYDNDNFDANENAQDNMVVLLKSFDLGADIAYIRSASETTHAFNQAQCGELSVLMLQAVQGLYAEYWAMKDKLAKCSTYAELDAFDLTW